jgi:hypothetical protein
VIVLTNDGTTTNLLPTGEDIFEGMVCKPDLVLTGPIKKLNSITDHYLITILAAAAQIIITNCCS